MLNLNLVNKSNHKVLVKIITDIMNIAKHKYLILLVDDEPDTTLALKEGIEGSGFALVDAFNDPLLALAAFKPGTYDLLLLDVKMNKMGGFELYREIQKKDKKANACFITAYEIYYESLKHEFPGLNVGCFITKPIEINSLVKRIKMELESR
ncbi:MAG: response regulator [Nitrososphaeraceae archaeon]